MRRALLGQKDAIVRRKGRRTQGRVQSPKYLPIGQYEGSDNRTIVCKVVVIAAYGSRGRNIQQGEN